MKNGCDKSRDTDNTLVIMKNGCLWEVNIGFKILKRKVKSPLKQTTPLKICSAPFLNSPELQYSRFFMSKSVKKSVKAWRKSKSGVRVAWRKRREAPVGRVRREKTTHCLVSTQ